MIYSLFYWPILLRFFTDSKSKPTRLRSSQPRHSYLCFLQRCARSNTIPILMDMLNFIFEIEQANIIEFLYVLLEDIGAEIMYIFEYFRL
jgi:hypothetical protein